MFIRSVRILFLLTLASCAGTPPQGATQTAADYSTECKHENIGSNIVSRDCRDRPSARHDVIPDLVQQMPSTGGGK